MGHRNNVCPGCGFTGFEWIFDTSGVLKLTCSSILWMLSVMLTLVLNCKSSIVQFTKYLIGLQVCVHGQNCIVQFSKCFVGTLCHQCQKWSGFSCLKSHIQCPHCQIWFSHYWLKSQACRLSTQSGTDSLVFRVFYCSQILSQKSGMYSSVFRVCHWSTKLCTDCIQSQLYSLVFRVSLVYKCIVQFSESVMDKQACEMVRVLQFKFVYTVRVV